MSKRIVALPVAMVAMLALAVFAPGIANATNSTVSISMSPAGGGFQGKVGPASCDAQRTVQLKRAPSGSNNFTVIGSDKTDAGGNWKVNTTPQPNAKYKATALAKGACNAFTSKTLTARQTQSSIAIGSLGASFKGKVSSIDDCVNGRSVKLQRKTASQDQFSNVGSPDTSAGNGAWEVLTEPVNGAQYRGSVSAKTVGNDACMAANSPITTARQSTVTIAQGGSSNFHGNVNSPVAACENNRTVSLQRSDTFPYSSFTTVGSDATNNAGVWQVNTVVVTGAKYRARVGPKQVAGNSCLDDISPTVTGT